MVEIKNGSIFGTVEIPVHDCSVYAVLKYCKMDGYTPTEIAQMLHVDPQHVRNVAGSLKRAGKHDILRKGNGGAKKGQHKVDIKDIKQQEGFQGKLVRLMIANNDNYSTLSRAIHVNVNSVYRWVRKGVTPEMANVKKIADHYCVQTAWLLGEAKSPLRRW